MVSKVILCALITIVAAQRPQPQLPTHGVPATDDGDDGTWTEEKYEAPPGNEVGGRQYAAQPQYRPQPQPQYRPQPQPQPQYQAPAPQPQYRPQPQPQYQPPAPQPQYRPAPQSQQYQAPAQPQYRPEPRPQPQYQPPAQQYRPQPQQSSQGSDYKNAAILSEARYLQGDGKFGAAYTQDDGVEFKEESDADGTRRGTYSWVDPSGERRTVSYVAGKNGFQATGAHLPVAPEGPAAAAPAPQPQYRPEPQQYQAQPEYQPQPQYRSQSQPPSSNTLYDVQY